MKRLLAFMLSVAVMCAMNACSVSCPAGSEPGTAPSQSTGGSIPTQPSESDPTGPSTGMGDGYIDPDTDPFDPGTLPSEPDIDIPEDPTQELHYEYPMDTITKDPGTIADATNKYTIAPGWHGALIDLQNIAYNAVTITKRSGAEFFGYAFLAGELRAGYSPTYAKGYTRVIYSSKKSATLDIPDNARYLYIYHNSKEDYYLPSGVKFFNKSVIPETGASLRIATWNIGHFSMGKKPDSTITDANYTASGEKYRSFIQNGLDADIIALQEYSAKFTPSYGTAESLFSNYSFCKEGVQSRYSCNAIFAKRPISNIQAHEFACNKTATITHTNLIAATDYYYMTADVKIGGETVKLVTAHLAFDNNKKPDTVNLNQIKELIEVFKDEERVVFVGDWNAKVFSTFDLFTDAGYTLANTDSTLYTINNGNLSLDNIIYKGVKVSDFTLCGSDLSDHYALSCTVTLP